MPVSVALALSNSNVLANQPATIVATVSNTTAAAVTLNSLTASCPSGAVSIRQPLFATPNQAPGVGNPVIAATTGTASYAFDFVVMAPNTAGPNPTNAPGGVVPSNQAGPTQNPNHTITVIGQTSDGSVFSSSLTVGVLSAVGPFPRPEGGALQFTQGANLMTLALLGAL